MYIDNKIYSLYLQSLKITKKELLDSNYEEIVNEKLTTKSLCKFLVENKVYIYEDNLYLLYKLIVPNKSTYSGISLNGLDKVKERFSTLKSNLNVSGIKDVDKALKYAYVYYITNFNCCKNTDDLYNLAKSMNIDSKLEYLVGIELIRSHKLANVNDKLSCFEVYQNYHAGNIVDTPLKDMSSFKSVHKDLMKLVTAQRDEIIEKQKKSAARKESKAIDLNMIADSLTDLSVSKLKATYPFCAIITSSYSSGWAQDSTKITKHYYFTNLSKSDIKSILKENGVNTKDSHEQYSNGISYDLEWGGEAIANKGNSFEYEVSSNVKDFTPGEEHQYSRYTAGTTYYRYAHIIAKPNNSFNNKVYRLKDRSGKLYIPKDNIKIIDTNLDGRQLINSDYKYAGFFYGQFDSIDSTHASKINYDDAIKLIESNNANLLELGVRAYIKDDYSDYVKYVGDNIYNYIDFDISSYFSNVTRARYGYFKADFTLGSFTEFIDIYAKGISITIPSDKKLYAIYKQENDKIYVMEYKSIFNEKVNTFSINKDAFDNIFEEVEQYN